MGQNRRDRDSFFSAQEIGDDSAECHLVSDWQKSLVSDLRRLKIGKNIAVLWKSVMPSVKANQILFDTMNICDIAETLTNWRILSILLKIAAHPLEIACSAGVQSIFVVCNLYNDRVKISLIWSSLGDVPLHLFAHPTPLQYCQLPLFASWWLR